MKTTRFFAVFLAVLTLFLAACEHTLDPIPPERQRVLYSVLIEKQSHGTIMAFPDKAYQGTEIIAVINPDYGYVLKPDSLAMDTLSVTASFEMPGKSVWLTGVFVPVEEAYPGRNYQTVHIGPVRNGYITASPQFGTPGTAVTLTIVPDVGYGLKQGIQINGSQLSGPPYKFDLGSSPVMVTAEFEPKAADTLVASGKQALSVGDYNSAQVYFEGAYAKDKSNDEALFYSTIGKLAGITVNTQVRNLLKGRLPFTNDYPNSLNRLFSTEWLQDFDGKTLFPVAAAPPAFVNNVSLYQDTLNGLSQQTMATFLRLIWVDFLYRNPNGYNDLLDDLLRYVFGNTFEEAAARAEAMGDRRIILDDQGIINSLKLTDYYAVGDTIGGVELGALISVWRLGKAAVEWAAAYDWEIKTDIFPWIFNVAGENDVNLLFSDTSYGLLSGITFVMRNKFVSELESVLPFRNNFMKDRKNGLMKNSRTDLAKAVDGLDKAWTYYFGTTPGIPLGVKAALDRYNSIGQGLRQIQTALKTGGGIFYIPAAIQPGDWADASTAPLGINVDKLFTPGQLSIDKIIVTEKGGKSPVFVGFAAADGTGAGTVITNKAQFAQYNAIGFQLDAAALKEVFVKKYDAYGAKEWVHTLAPAITPINRRNGEEFYNWYHK